MAENIPLGQNETLFVPFRLENAGAVHMSLKEIRKWKDNIQRTRSLSCVEFDLMYVAGNNRIQITEREKIAVVLAIVTGFGLPVVIILLIRAYRHGRWVQLEDFKEPSQSMFCPTGRGDKNTELKHLVQCSLFIFVSDLEVKLCMQWLAGLDVQDTVKCQGLAVTHSGLFAVCPSNCANITGHWV